VELPATNEDEESIPSFAGNPARRLQKAGAMKKVLTIDDEPYVARLLRTVLKEAWGEDVDLDWAADGGIGKVKAATGDYDLITLDIGMPLMGGLEALAEIKRNPRSAQTPVVVITGLDDPALPRQAHSLGAAGFVRKPFSVEELKRIIHDIALLYRPRAGPEKT